MRRRLYAVVAVAALGLAMPSHAEDPKTLDGKKTTKIELKASGGNQQHDDWILFGYPDIAKCKAPEECLRLDFVFKPDNVAGDVVFTIGWQNNQSDMDLYVYDKDGKEVDHCGAAIGTSEAIAVPGNKLVSGEKYTLVANYYRSFDDEVTATVEFPATLAAGPYAAASAVDAIQPTSCAS